MMRDNFIKSLCLLCAYALFALGMAFGIYQPIRDQADHFTEPTLFYIAPGDGLKRIAYKFTENRLVEAAWHVILVAKAQGLERSLKAGEYEFPAASTLAEKLAQIANGTVYLRRISIPEGLSVAEVDLIIQQTDGLRLDDYVIPTEGSILPETYYFERGESAKTLVSRMQASLTKVAMTLWEQRTYDLPFDTLEEAIILASIVEKETAIPSERPLVAAVFVNRLKKGMRLQSDPTTIYGITGGLPLGRGLKRSELRAETPYNTYRLNGLPAGPIANPGKESLAAVMNPTDVDYLYFVADGTGGHVFATTLEEHNENVRRWRQIERKQLER